MSQFIGRILDLLLSCGPICTHIFRQNYANYLLCKVQTSVLHRDSPPTHTHTTHTPRQIAALDLLPLGLRNAAVECHTMPNFWSLLSQLKVFVLRICEDNHAIKVEGHSKSALEIVIID